MKIKFRFLCCLVLLTWVLALCPVCLADSFSQTELQSSGLARVVEENRNPFLAGSNGIMRPDYDLAASRIQLHGLIRVGKDRRAMISVEGESNSLLNFLNLSQGTSVRVMVNGMEYVFTTRLKANGVVLTGENKKDYEVKL